MSTEIKSFFGHKLRITGDDDVVTVNPSDFGARGYARAESLAAVETECHVRLVPADTIVIDRSELPEVTEDGEGYATAGVNGPCASLVGIVRTGTEAIRRDALATLALADYLDTHPPVDEAQVEALADVIAGEYPDATFFPGAGSMARRLIATGKVSVTK